MQHDALDHLQRGRRDALVARVGERHQERHEARKDEQDVLPWSEARHLDSKDDQIHDRIDRDHDQRCQQRPAYPEDRPRIAGNEFVAGHPP